jgi:effector-binding domain-containing protein
MVIDWTLILDIARELLRVVGTIVGVIIGAKIAFSNASKGRREDILFKEKYKVYERMETIIGEIIIDYNDVNSKRTMAIYYWITELAPAWDWTPPNDEEKLQMNSELGDICRYFFAKHNTRLFDFRVKAMFSKDLDERILYASTILFHYMEETESITKYIRDSMTNPPINLAEIKKQKIIEWRYSGGYHEAGTVLNMIKSAMFHELELPTEYREDLVPLEEFKKHVFDPKLQSITASTSHD